MQAALRRILWMTAVLMSAACASLSPAPSATAVATAVLIPAAPTFTASPAATALPDASVPVNALRTPASSALPDANAPLVLMAASDLAARADSVNAASEAAQLVRVEPATWRNPNFECESRRAVGDPIPGYRLVFVLGETVYEYHTDSGTEVRFCEEGSLYDDYPALLLELDATAGEMVSLARQQLARERGIAPEDAELLRVRPQTWTTTSLGCPVAGAPSSDAVIGGYEIVLLANTEEVVFHSDYAQVILCDVLP